MRKATPSLYWTYVRFTRNRLLRSNGFNALNMRCSLRNKYSIRIQHYKFASQSEPEPLIPTTNQPEGFRASDKPVSKQGKPQGFSPFKSIHHERAKTYNDFEKFESDKEFNIHPFWTPIVPILVIGLGIYIIVT
eukprot:352581_1